MIFRLQHVTGLLLALVIALTSVQMAVARGQSPAVGSMVICTGTGPVTVMLDENGEPTGALMICPDYALAFLAHVDLNEPRPTATLVWNGLETEIASVTAASHACPAAVARGPPVCL